MVEQLGNKIAHDLALLSARRRVAEPCLQKRRWRPHICVQARSRLHGIAFDNLASLGSRVLHRCIHKAKSHTLAADVPVNEATDHGPYRFVVYPGQSAKPFQGPVVLPGSNRAPTDGLTIPVSKYANGTSRAHQVLQCAIQLPFVECLYSVLVILQRIQEQ